MTQDREEEVKLQGGGATCQNTLVNPDTVKLSNVTVTGFGERCNLVREGEMFIKDEAEISSTVRGVKWGIVHFGKLVFESDEQEFSLWGVKSKKISSYPSINQFIKQKDRSATYTDMHVIDIEIV